MPYPDTHFNLVRFSTHLHINLIQDHTPYFRGEMRGSCSKQIKEKANQYDRRFSQVQMINIKMNPFLMPSALMKEYSADMVYSVSKTQ